MTSFILGPFAAILALPAIIDFNRQLLGKYESTNSRRLITGCMYGYGLAWSIWEFAQGRWSPLLLITAALSGGFMWVALSRRRFVRLLRHLELYQEYFERCRADDVRRAAQRRPMNV